MGATAGWSANPASAMLDRTTDIQEAWRLAYIAIGDQARATRATARGFAQISAAHPDTAPSRRDLLTATLRNSLRAANDEPGAAPDQVRGSAVTTALWQLAPNQRAALWLTQVGELDDEELGTVLSLSPANAEHVAERATGWLDVALDHGSGPLCQHEPRLSDFLAGKLPAVEAAEINTHLPSCGTCQSKVNAFEELADLAVVLRRAVPNPPATITAEALGQQPPDLSATDPEPGPASIPRPPAVRPLAMCCAALLAIGALGVGILRPAHGATDPMTINGPPDATKVAPTGGGGASTSATARVATTVTAAPTTSTTLQPAVTFPTVPHR